MDNLLTWNCRHIANAEIQTANRSTCLLARAVARRKSLWEDRKMRNDEFLADAVVEEIRRVGQEHAARFGYDIHRICGGIREHEKASHLRFVTPEPRRPATTSTK